MAARSVLLTGANGSLAIPAIHHLLSTQPSVTAILTVRNPSSNDPNTSRLRETITPFQDRVSLRPLDLADLPAVHGFARSLVAEISSGTVPRLGSIICNAFYWNLTSPAKLTGDGFEKTFQVNHIAHAALILRLLGSCAANARVILFASDAHFPGKNSLEKYPPSLPEVKEQAGEAEGTKEYDSLVHLDGNGKDDPLGRGFQRYANSKLAIISWMYALNRHIHHAAAAAHAESEQGTKSHLPDGITAIAVNPGNLSDSRALRVNTPASLQMVSRVIIRPLRPLLRLVDPTMRTAGDAGSDVIDLAVGSEYLHAKGYYTMRKKDESSEESRDEKKQEALWRKTVEWTGIKEDDTVLTL
jgi:NAD(P)-dependent dehydrogenase (short-subunit alcohol dehydrogenase family)